MVTSYASEEETLIVELIEFLTKDLQECLDSPKCTKSLPKPICEKFKDEKTELCSFINDNHTLTVRIKKDKNAYKDQVVSTYFTTNDDNFPWTTLDTHYSWRDYDESQGFMYGKWFILDLMCPKELATCVFQIPDIKEYSGSELYSP